MSQNPDTQEEQDRWLLENKEAIDAEIRRGIEQLDRGEGIPEDQLDAHLARLKSPALVRSCHQVMGEGLAVTCA